MDIDGRGAKGKDNTFLIGCLVAVVIALALAALGAWWVYRSARAAIAEGMHQGMVQVIEDSELSDEQKTKLTAHFDRLHGDFQAGRIGISEMVAVLEQVGESRIMDQMPLWSVRSMYIDRLVIGEAERAEIELQFQRYARGIHEGKIPPEKLDEATAPLMEPDPEIEGEQRFKEKITPEEFHEFVSNMKEISDEAEIPVEPYEIDFAAEVGKSIDAALKQQQE